MGLINKGRRNWQRIVGSSNDFSLETRIYHAFCFLTIAALIFIVPVKYYVGLVFTSLLGIALAVIVACTFYLSRYKHQPRLSIRITAVFVNLIFGINYFVNGGISSSAVLLIAFSYFAIILVSPKKEQWLWTMVNLLVFFVPVVFEYIYPSVVNGYLTGKYYLIDIACTYLVLIGLMRIIIPNIIRNYNQTKKSAELKTLALLKLNEEKSKLISIISHDMRTPLSNVQTYLELLLEDDFSAEEQRDIKNSLLQSTRGTLDMLTNVLIWSKNQMDGHHIAITKIDMSALLLVGQQLYKNIARQKNIGLDYVISSSIEVLGDNDMMNLIIRNLINNAIKFTSPGGNILVMAEKNAEYCIIEVRDSGTGSPVKLDQNVFKFSVKTTYGTNNEKGVGLGLALCKQYIEAQNGKIWFKNDQVSGTSFYLQVPLSPE